LDTRVPFSSLFPLAAAGGGSSGFGGGGGGGGFSGGGGGYYGGGGGGMPLWLIILIGLAVAAFVVFGWIQTMRYNRRRKERADRVHKAAMEASQDDTLFDPDTVNDQACALFLEIQAAWDARDRDKLATLCGDDLIVEWKRRLDDFDRKGWHNRVQPHGNPTIEFVGLVNREGTEADRVVVRLTAHMDDYVETSTGQRILKDGKESAATTMVEYWTLFQRDGRWVLLSIESDDEGRHNLDSEIVASPWADSQVADAALVETAVADAAPADVKTSEIADLDFDGTARAAALDLSLADGRFAPDVLEVAVRRAVAAWAEAIDGPDTALAGIATPAAIESLLYPGDDNHTTRLVVRGPQVQQMTITALDAAAEPPTMTATIRVKGARYVENRDTVALVSGSRDWVTTFTETWTFALQPDKPDQPWIVADAEAARVAS
jgi:predicted lipid-binding transport protein (Tim44 family)